MIFETKRLQVRKLIFNDLDAFHKMQSNPNVMKFVTGNPKSKESHAEELKMLIKKYENPNNNFWIYAICRKEDFQFIGTVALVKDNKDDEIGYRFLEEFWSFGYGFEICKGLIEYCKLLKIKKLIAYVVDENIASKKIIEKLNFKKVKNFISEDLKLPETKYEIIV